MHKFTTSGHNWYVKLRAKGYSKWTEFFLFFLIYSGCPQITCINVNPGLEPPRRLLLQYLDLTDCASIQDSGLKIIVRNCPLLVYLYLRRCVQITGLCSMLNKKYLLY